LLNDKKSVTVLTNFVKFHYLLLYPSTAWNYKYSIKLS